MLAWLCLTCGALRQLPRQGHETACRRPHHGLMSCAADCGSRGPLLDRGRRTSTRVTFEKLQRAHLSGPLGGLQPSVAGPLAHACATGSRQVSEPGSQDTCG